MNTSKINDHRTWRKWYESGAVMQTVFPDGTLVIDAVGENRSGPHKGYITLTLGRVHNPNGWKPICAVVVQKHEKFRLGVILHAIPNNAVPVNVFYQR